MTYITGKRDSIIKYLSENALYSHTLPEICSAVLNGEKGKSTVYRIISELCQEGRVRKISDEKTRHCSYQYVGGHCLEHFHLKCKECGRLIHLDCDITGELRRAVLENNGFAIDDGAFLFGKCEKCISTNGRRI